MAEVESEFHIARRDRAVPVQLGVPDQGPTGGLEGMGEGLPSPQSVPHRHSA